MKNTLFETDTRLIIRFGGKEFQSVNEAKVDALMTFPTMNMDTALALVQDAQKAADILLWQPDSEASKTPVAPPAVSDSQILAACNEHGVVPFKIAKKRIRNQGWDLERATTTPLRPRTVKAKSTPQSAQVTGTAAYAAPYGAAVVTPHTA